MSRSSRVAPEGHGANMSSADEELQRDHQGRACWASNLLLLIQSIQEGTQVLQGVSLKVTPWKKGLCPGMGSLIHSFQPSSWGLLRAQNFLSVNSIKIWHKAFREGNESGISDSNSNPSPEVTSSLEQGGIQELQAVALP